MQVAEEFKVQSSSGHTVTLQRIAKGISYLDFGMTHLPRDFEGLRVKFTDRTAQDMGDGTFKLSDSAIPYSKV